MRGYSIHVDFFEFENVYDIDRLKDHCDFAERQIQRLQEAIEHVRKYQLELYDHVQTVLQTDFEKVVTIYRREEYVKFNKTKIFYYVRLEHRPKIENFDTYRTVYKYEFNEKFPGTERHKAFKYADELAAAHHCRIEKTGRW